MRKKILYHCGCSLLALSLLFGCKEEDASLAAGEGRLLLQVKLEDNISAIVTRADNEIPPVSTEDLDKACKIYIRNGKGLVKKYESKQEMPEELWLAADEYTISAVAGDSVSAGFNTPYYKGEEKITVAPGQVAATHVQCKLANVLASVDFVDKLDTEFTEYKVRLSTTKGTLEFTSANREAVGYFMMPGNSNQLGWAFEGKKKDGSPYSKTGMVENVKSCTQYILAFTIGDDNTAEGGAFIKLTVDEQPLREEEHSVGFYQRPQILGNNFDIAQPLFLEVGNGSETAIWVNTSSQLESLQVESEYFATLGLEPAYDLVHASETAVAALKEKGIYYVSKYDGENDQTTAKLTFGEVLVKAFPEGEYVFLLTATDKNGLSHTQDLTFTVSDAVVVTSAANSAYVWTNKARLSGKKVKDTAEELGFRYREQGSQEWIAVTSPVTMGDNNEFHAEITGLSAGSRYEYQAMSGEFASNVVSSFVTEAELQLPNAGFESWYKDGKVWLVRGDGEGLFWDTGNHGSATMNKNVTNYVETDVHGGSKAIELKSQFVGWGIVGKFAAGNLFAGQYLRTDGTDGVLSFGRPFTSRPAALKGFYKYASMPVTHTSLDNVAKGTPDQGTIYVAIGDWNEPVEIRTKASDRKLFDVNDPHIIAYGELIQGSSVESWTEFNIPLEYRATDRKPTYIVIVASASRYGDYFTGGEGSTMYLDDVELLYNNN